MENPKSEIEKRVGGSVRRGRPGRGVVAAFGCQLVRHAVGVGDENLYRAGAVRCKSEHGTVR